MDSRVIEKEAEVRRQMGIDDSVPSLHPDSVESLEIGRVRRHENQVVGERDRRDLGVYEWCGATRRLEARALARMPFGSAAIVVQDRKVRQHDLLEVTLDTRSSFGGRESQAPELKLVPDQRRDRRFGSVSAESAENAGGWPWAERFQYHVRVQ